MIAFMAVGDMMLSINRGTGRMIRQNGPHYLFEKIRPFFDQADLLFGNLESPIADDGVPCTNREPHITFRAESKSAEGLKRAGFNVLSAANNHITDYGEYGLRSTAEVLGKDVADGVL
jgi:poly-gamma-glutamate synthesis protein (capsule biosynthesis protein)